jgi:DNA-binding transcriptional MerR regulator
VTDDEDVAPGNLAIGDLAALAGVSTRAIRHYHAVGLLPEPERDTSGYRRYGPADVVNAVRVARLRTLGMPIATIREQVGSGAVDLTTALRDLAEDLGREVERLTTVRNRLRALADAGPGAPAEAMAEALRVAGRLAAGPLPAAEHEAATLVDALHPGGMAGALETAGPLLADPELMDRLAGLLERFRALPESQEDPDELAAEISAALPRPANAPPPVDVAVLDRLFGDRLAAQQLRCLHRVRALLEGTA